MSDPVKIRILNSGSELSAEKGDRLLDVLQKNGINIASPCGGSGICGKCRVLLDGEPRLACLTALEKDCAVKILRQEEDLVIEQENRGFSFKFTPQNGFGIAVDIGTTTVVAYLMDLQSGKTLKAVSEPNEQRIYGADVIARIDNAAKCGLEALSGAIRRQIGRMIKELMKEAPAGSLSAIAIAGNTVMLHFLAGLDPSGIAVAPFTPESLFGCSVPAKEIGLMADCEAFLFPCVAGYVGGDITAGLLSSGAFREKELCLFVDLGTNGEMALGDENGYTCCAAAAGPAFEGACIECGSPAVPGAISRAWVEDGAIRYETVGGKAAVSICGSGLVDLTAALLELGIVDETGRMLDEDEAKECGTSEKWIRCLEETDDGMRFCLNDVKTVWISAKDIRQVQLAKAAVAAGIRTLLAEAGKSSKDIHKIFLAGGFGNYISKEGAAAIGLLPPSCIDRITVTGNSAGAGAAAWLISDEAKEELKKLEEKCRYLELSSTAAFQEFYIDEMMFEA